MRTLVLRVVAEPPQVFWAPLLPAAGNVLINITAMLFGIMGFNVNMNAIARPNILRDDLDADEERLRIARIPRPSTAILNGAAE